MGVALTLLSQRYKNNNRTTNRALNTPGVLSLWVTVVPWNGFSCNPKGAPHMLSAHPLVELIPSHLYLDLVIVEVDVCLGSLSCWKTNYESTKCKPDGLHWYFCFIEIIISNLRLNLLSLLSTSDLGTKWGTRVTFFLYDSHWTRGWCDHSWVKVTYCFPVSSDYHQTSPSIKSPLLSFEICLSQLNQ